MWRIEDRRLPGRYIGLLAAVAAGVVPTVRVAAASTNAEVVATIGSEKITLRDLDKIALKSNMKLAQSLYDARRSALDQLILERSLAAEAAAQGKTVDALIRGRIGERITPVTTPDIEAFYRSNKARLRGKTLEQATPQIRSYLITQRQKTAKAKLIAELKKKGNVRITLDAPRIDIVVSADEPTKGPANAKVTIIEYSDFQ